MMWIIACMDAHIASALDVGQTAHIGLQKCAIRLTALTASMQPRPKEDIKRRTEDQATRPSHKMNCTDFQQKHEKHASLKIPTSSVENNARSNVAWYLEIC